MAKNNKENGNILRDHPRLRVHEHKYKWGVIFQSEDFEAKKVPFQNNTNIYQR
jgi:hypothetical protein